MIHATVKQEKLDEYLDLVKLLIKETTKKGCFCYSFNQRKDKPTEFVLYEQWESQQDLDNHIKELFKILGPSKSGYPVPDKLMSMYEKVEPVFYDIVGHAQQLNRSKVC